MPDFRRPPDIVPNIWCAQALLLVLTVAQRESVTAAAVAARQGPGRSATRARVRVSLDACLIIYLSSECRSTVRTRAGFGEWFDQHCESGLRLTQWSPQTSFRNADGGSDLTAIRRTSLQAQTQGEQLDTECHRHAGDIPGQMTVVS